MGSKIHYDVFAEKNHISMIPDLKFEPIDEDVFETIQSEGLDEEFGLYDKDEWECAVLPISEDDKRGLMNFDSNALEKFNDFDVELKEKYDMKYVDLIDYENGEVKIIRKTMG